MMGPGEKGKRTFVNFRRGVNGFPGWGGMRLYGEPANLGNYFRHVENGRPRYGLWFRRPGYEQLNTTTVHSTSAHFNWCSSVETNPLRIYGAGGGCTGVDTVGFTLTWFDMDQEPRLQRSTYYSTIEDLSVGLFDNRIWVGLSDTAPSRTSEFRRYETVAAPWGKDQVDLAGRKQEYPIYTFPGRTIAWMETFDNKLFISLDDGTTGGAADNRLAAYDGLSMFDGSVTTMPADLSGLDYPITTMCRTRDFLVAGFASGFNRIMVRKVGAVPGTWNTVIPAAGTIQARRMVEYKNQLYVVPGGTGANATNIWAWNDTEPPSYAGATLTTVRTIANSEITACAVFNGYLYYGWRATGNSHVMIGRYDGTTWTDSHKDLTAQATDSGSVPSLLKRIDDLVAYRGSLYAAVFSDIQANPPVVDGVYLVYSPGTATSGTWVIQNRQTVANPGGSSPVNSDNDRRLLISPETGGIVKRLLVA